ncbi:Xylanase inhibitor, N-terminal [Sesbania bispinosa]|nr:Xylanase inhibitor, N-terminal [Sesbania bispinosa]
MIPGGGEYLLKMSLGTPAIEVIGIADTGSDIIWTQCQLCVHCYNQTIPVFDPNHSSSFNVVPCTDSTSISLPNVVFGCSYDTVGIFDKSGSGIIKVLNLDCSRVKVFTVTDIAAAVIQIAGVAVISHPFEISFRCGIVQLRNRYVADDFGVAERYLEPWT